MARYQRRNVTLKQRAKLPDCWEFRWRENGVQRSRILGNIEEFPTMDDAQKAADAVRLEINAEHAQAVPTTVATLIDRYLEDPYEKERLAFSTHNSYRCYLRNYVKPKWGSFLLRDVRTLAIETWLRGIKLAPKTKLHIRNVMHVLYECAARWELVEKSPITRVRQGGARLADPEILTPEEFRSLLGNLTTEPYRMMVILAGCLDLARSEFIGLKWGDFNWQDSTLAVQRGVVNCHVGNTKTLARRKPIPIDEKLLAIVRAFRQSRAYRVDSDWVFASPASDGTSPYWPDSALDNFVKPAATTAGVTKQFGWHSFRHMYSTRLRANGTDIKVQQELLRHANPDITLAVYTQAVSDAKRAAHAQVVRELLPA
jgi:integrase